LQRNLIFNRISQETTIEMKPLRTIATITLVASLAIATLFIKTSVSNSTFFSKNSIKEQVSNKEGSNETRGFEEPADNVPLKESNPGSTSVFNYNFLFNLLYKFAHGELTR
jgi:hypothetical protein